MPTIYVSRNGNSYQLKLRDSEGHNPGNDDLTTDVGPGDIVTWELDPNGSGLSSIESITKAVPTLGPPPKYQGSVQLLTTDPVVVSSVGTGTVLSTSPGYHSFENYNVGFKVPGDNTIYYDDPKLQMNS